MIPKRGIVVHVFHKWRAFACHGAVAARTFRRLSRPLSEISSRPAPPVGPGLTSLLAEPTRPSTCCGLPSRCLPKSLSVLVWAEQDASPEVMPENGRRSKAALLGHLINRERRRLEQVLRSPDA